MIFHIYFALQLWSTSVLSEDLPSEIMNGLEDSWTFDWKDGGQQPEFFYDFRNLQNVPFQTVVKNVPEMTYKVELANVQGKHRGLIATKDIQPGELILASRAVALTQPGTKPDDYDSFEDLVTESVRVLTERPDLRPVVYNLWAGDELKYLDITAKPETLDIDKPRIEGACRKNHFVVHGAHKTVSGTTVNGRGLWVLPSFGNHGCVGNAVWMTRGDFMFFRAAKPIKRGQEILTSYNDSKKLWWERKAKLLEHDIECQCQLCELDRQEEEEWHNRRQEYYDKFRNERHKSPLSDLVKMSNALERMRNSPIAELNNAIFRIVYNVAAAARNLNNWTISFEYYEKSFDMVFGTTSNLEAPFVSMFALDTALTAGDKDQQTVWFEKFKKAVALVFGDLHMLDWYIDDFMKFVPSSSLKEFMSKHRHEIYVKAKESEERETCNAIDKCTRSN